MYMSQEDWTEELVAQLEGNVDSVKIWLQDQEGNDDAVLEICDVKREDGVVNLTVRLV